MISLLVDLHFFRRTKSSTYLMADSSWYHNLIAKVWVVMMVEGWMLAHFVACISCPRKSLDLIVQCQTLYWREGLKLVIIIHGWCPGLPFASRIGQVSLSLSFSMHFLKLPIIQLCLKNYLLLSKTYQHGILSNVNSFWTM